MNRKQRPSMLYPGLAVVALLSLMIAPVLTRPTFAQSGTVVRPQLLASAVAVGGTVDVQILVENVTDLFGVQARVHFDPAVLEVVDSDPARAGVQVVLGPFVTPDYEVVNQVDAAGGIVEFGYSQMHTQAVSGSGVIATITFRGRAPGVSALTLDNVVFAHTNGDPIALSTQGSELQVTGGSGDSPTPTTISPVATPTPTATSAAAQEALLSITPQHLSLVVGQTSTMAVHVQQASNLYGVQIYIHFDPGVSVDAVTPGTCVADLVAQAAVQQGVIQYAASLRAPSAPMNGDCDLFTFQVTGVTPGNQGFYFVTFLFSDVNGAPLPVSPHNATVVVTAAAGTATPTPSPTATAVGTTTPTPTPPGTVTPPPTATATPLPNCADVLGYHVVQPGDTLYAIGRAYAVWPYSIAQCNGIINPDLIYPGSRLAIPNSPWSPVPPGPTARPQFGSTVQPCSRSHVVQTGENLFRISLRYGVSMWAIAEANYILNLNYIQIGQVLCIP